MAQALGDITVSQVDKDDEDVLATVTGLAVATIRRRCRGTHGNTLVRNAFAKEWPIDGDSLGPLTVALCRDVGLEPEIAEASGLSLATIRRRLSQAHGKTLVRNAVPEVEYEEDDDIDEAPEPETTAVEADRWAREGNVVGWVAVVPVNVVRNSPTLLEAIAERLGCPPGKLRSSLKRVHGRTRLDNALGERWPVDPPSDPNSALAGMRAAWVRRAPSLSAWLGKLVGMRPHDVARRVAEAEGAVMMKTLFPALAEPAPRMRHGQPSNVAPQPAEPPVRPSDAQPERVGPNGRWVLGQLLGEGSFGRVFNAHDSTGETGRVVVKLARGAYAEFLRREGVKLTKVDHPNLPHCWDHGAGDRPYIVLDHAGESLSKIVAREGRALAEPEVIRVAHGVASALDYLHTELAIFHLDVKPDNIMVEGRGTMKPRVTLGDFGAAVDARPETLDLGARTLVVKSLVAYTRAYAAPELRYNEARRASDQYSLALVVCSMLEGRELVNGYQVRAFDRLTDQQNAATRRATTPDPDARFASCRAFVQELARQ